MYLNWDNTDLINNTNVLQVRVSKRLKSEGGAFNTTGFNPANDLNKNISTVQVLTEDNRAYQFKVESLCAQGGPVINDNGYQEGMTFACIPPAVTVLSTAAIRATVDLAMTDITKVRFVLRRVSNNAIIETVTVNQSNSIATYDFLNLEPQTTYYVTTEFYAMVNGVEVISSAAQYQNSVCGASDAPAYVGTTLALHGGGEGTTPSKTFKNDTPYQVDFGINGNTVIMDAGATFYNQVYSSNSGDTLLINMIEWGLIPSVYLILRLNGSAIQNPEIITPGQIINLPVQSAYDTIEFSPATPQ